MTSTHFRGANVVGEGGFGIATVVVLKKKKKKKGNDQPMVTLAGIIRYQPLTRQGRVSNCFS